MSILYEHLGLALVLALDWQVNPLPMTTPQVDLDREKMNERQNRERQRQRKRNHKRGK